MRRGWMVLVLLAFILIGLNSVGAARRNMAYVNLVHGRFDAWQQFATTASDGTKPGRLARLRRSLERSDWPETERMLALQANDADRLAPLLVVHDAERRVESGDLAGARAALRAVSAQSTYEAGVLYRVGAAWERAQSPADAVRTYERGAERDAAGRWAEGHYRAAMVHQRDAQWPLLQKLLAPLLESASDLDLKRPIRPRDPGGAVWQGTFLALGEAYEHLGRPRDAKATYERLARIVGPRRDWTLNRALVSLAVARSGDGEIALAVDAVVRALDLSTEFDTSYRARFELDTAAEAVRIVDTVSATGRLDALETSADELTRRLATSPGAWFVRGLISEARCDTVRARSDYARAAELVPAGAGAFLAGRPADSSKTPCRQR